MKKYLIRMYVFAGMFCAISVYRIITTISPSEWAMCGYDGLFIFSNNNSKTILPMIMVYCNLNAMRYDFIPHNIVRQRDKLTVWYKHAVRIAVQCVTVVAMLMVIAFCVSYFQTGVLCNKEGERSILAVELLRAGMSVPKELNLICMCLQALLINSLQLYAYVMVALLIYWLSDSGVLAVLAVLTVGIIVPGRNSMYKSDLNVEFTPYYTELLDVYRYMQNVFLIIIMLCAIFGIAMYVVPRKQFIKGRAYE